MDHGRVLRLQRFVGDLRFGAETLLLGQALLSREASLASERRLLVEESTLGARQNVNIAVIASSITNLLQNLIIGDSRVFVEVVVIGGELIVLQQLCMIAPAALGVLPTDSRGEAT